jgi:hypothetical protein
MLPRPSEIDVEELELADEESPKSYLEHRFEPDLRFEPVPQSPLESRRLGLRAPASFSVFVTRRDKRIRARAAEISTTGVLLDFRHAEPCSFDGLVTLELAVPALPRPIRCAARLARHVGRLEAFEFMIIGRDDRLSLAEYIDRVARPRVKAQTATKSGSSLTSRLPALLPGERVLGAFLRHEVAEHQIYHLLNQGFLVEPRRALEQASEHRRADRLHDDERGGIDALRSHRCAGGDQEVAHDFDDAQIERVHAIRFDDA